MSKAEVIEAAPKTETKPKSGKGLAITGFIFALVALLITGYNSYLLYSIYRTRTAGTFVQDFAKDSNSANFTEGSIADVASRVAPSVVSIITETKTKSYSFFYGETESTGAAAGTGIIVSSDGPHQ